MALCKCGCGQETTMHKGKPRLFIYGHQNRGKSYWKKQLPKMCECGCGEYANLGRRFIKGHNHRGKTRSSTQAIEHEPLPDGWKSRLCNITDNKESPVYLGSVAETILSNVYTDVRVMPYGNHGYDIICNRGMKIDVKSSATGDKNNAWQFLINRNNIADYFLCIAFNSRNDLKRPVHLWLIPAQKINNLTGFEIRKTTLEKWSIYELSLDRVLACCGDIYSSKHL